jgi:hypothetical protein
MEDSHDLTNCPPRAVVEMILTLSRQAHQVFAVPYM